MACPRCRRLAAQWAQEKAEFDRLDPEAEGLARDKIKDLVLKQAAVISDCCGPKEASRLLGLMWPDLSG